MLLDFAMYLLIGFLFSTWLVIEVARMGKEAEMVDGFDFAASFIGIMFLYPFFILRAIISMLSKRV